MKLWLISLITLLSRKILLSYCEGVIYKEDEVEVVFEGDDKETCKFIIPGRSLMKLLKKKFYFKIIST